MTTLRHFAPLLAGCIAGFAVSVIEARLTPSSPLQLPLPAIPLHIYIA